MPNHDDYSEYKEGADELLIPESFSNAPRCRLKDARKARELAQRFQDDSAARDQFFALLNRQLDGNPPYDQLELERQGQSYRANFNPMEAAAYRDSAVTPHYDIYSGGLLYFYIKFSRRKLGTTAELADQYSQAISEIANRMVDEWHGFDENNQPRISDTVWFGKGFLMWEDERDWRYRYVPQHMVKVPQGSSIIMEEMPIMAIFGEMRVHELWAKIRNAKAAQDRGWHLETCLDAIANAMPRDPNQGNTTYPNYVELQQALNDNDVHTGYYSDVINIANIYVREFDGSITHAIVSMDALRKDNAKPGDSYATAKNGQKSDQGVYQDDYLFHKVGRFKEWSQCIASFFLKNSNGSWNGSSGQGKDMYPVMQAKMRLENAVWDLAFLDTGIWLQAKTARALEQASMIQAGAFNIIPPDFEAQQTQIRGNIGDPLSMLEHSDQLLQRNTGIYRQPFMEREGGGNPPTARQVTAGYQDRNQLSNSMVNRSYRQYDKLYSEVVRRLFMDAEFRERLKDEGLPEECLDHNNVESVKASRVIGNGSPQNRLSAIQATGPIVSQLPEAGKVNWINDLIAASADRATVERWNPRPQSKTSDDHARMAELENAAVKAGGAINPSDTDNDVIHLDTHIMAKAMALQSIQQGADPVDVLDFIDRMGGNGTPQNPGHEGVHWHRLKGDKAHEAQFKALAQTNMQLLRAADELRTHVDGHLNRRRQDAAKAKAMQMDPLTKAKVQKEQLGMRTKWEKHIQQSRIKDEQANQKARASEADIAIKDAQAAAEIRRKSFSAFTPE